MSSLTSAVVFARALLYAAAEYLRDGESGDADGGESLLEVFKL